MDITRRDMFKACGLGAVALFASPYLNVFNPSEAFGADAVPKNVFTLKYTNKDADAVSSVQHVQTMVRSSAGNPNMKSDLIINRNVFGGTSSRPALPDKVAFYRDGKVVKSITPKDPYRVTDTFTAADKANAFATGAGGQNLDTDGEKFFSWGAIPHDSGNFGWKNNGYAVGIRVNLAKAKKFLGAPLISYSDIGTYLKLVWNKIGITQSGQEFGMVLLIPQVDVAKGSTNPGGGWGSVFVLGKHDNDGGSYSDKWLWSCCTSSTGNHTYSMDAAFIIKFHPVGADKKINENDNSLNGKGVIFEFADYDMYGYSGGARSNAKTCSRWREAIWLRSSNTVKEVWLKGKSFIKATATSKAKGNLLGLNKNRNSIVDDDNNPIWSVHPEYELISQFRSIPVIQTHKDSVQDTSNIQGDACTFFAKLCHGDRFIWSGSSCISALLAEPEKFKVRVIIDSTSTGTGHVDCYLNGNSDDVYWVSDVGNAKRAILSPIASDSECAREFSGTNWPIFDVVPDAGCFVDYTEARVWKSNTPGAKTNVFVGVGDKQTKKVDTDLTYEQYTAGTHRLIAPQGANVGKNPFNKNLSIVPASQPRPVIDGDYVIIVKFGKDDDDSPGSINVITESDRPDFVRDLNTYKIDDGYVGLYTDSKTANLYAPSISGWINPQTGGYYLDGSDPQALVTFTPVETTAKNKTEATKATTAAAGHYYYRQTTPATGHKINTSQYKGNAYAWAGSSETYTVQDIAVHLPLSTALLTKIDPEKKKPEGSGDASIANARFELRYWDNYNWSGASKAAATWMTRADGSLYITDSCASGSWPYKTVIDGTVNTLPLGSYEVIELSCADGYEVSHVAHRFTVEQDSAGNAVMERDGNWMLWDGRDDGFEQEYIWRGGLKIQKVDSDQALAKNKRKHRIDLGWDEAQGNASLAGAIFKVYNVSEKSFKDKYANRVVDTCKGKALTEAACVCTLITDEHGRCSTPADQLVYGRYLIVEVAAPEGYKLNPVFAEGYPIAITADKEIVALVVGNQEFVGVDNA